MATEQKVQKSVRGNEINSIRAVAVTSFLDKLVREGRKGAYRFTPRVGKRQLPKAEILAHLRRNGLAVAIQADGSWIIGVPAVPQAEEGTGNVTT